MKAEYVPVMPAALDMDFVSLVRERVTDRMYGKLERQIADDRIDLLLGPDAKEKPWQSFMEVMDGITFAWAHIDPDAHPDAIKQRLTTLTVHFTGETERDRFQRLYDELLNGIHDVAVRPHFTPLGSWGLRIKNFGYPDVCTGGRVADLYFARQYASMRQDLRLVLGHSLDAIGHSAVTWHMPDDLRDRVRQQRRVLGDIIGDEAASNSLLTSGNLGIIGLAVRRALEGTGPLDVQRPRDNRPLIEQKTRFRAVASKTASGIPISVTTMGRALLGQVQDRFEDLSRPYRRGHIDVVQAMIDLKDLAVDLGIINEGIGATVRAVGLLALGLGGAHKKARRDKWTKQQRIQRLGDLLGIEGPRKKSILPTK